MERLKDTLDRIQENVVAFDINGTVTYVNEAFANLCKLKTEQMIGKNIWVLQPHLVGTPLYRNIIESIEKNEVRKIEWKGEVTGKIWETSLFPSENGITAVGRDITERKKAEETLKASESLYRALFDNSEDGFMLLEPIFNETGKAHDFVFLQLNSAYERLTGAQAGDILSKRASQATPELEQQVILIVDEVVKTGKSVYNEAYNKRSNKWYDSHYFLYAEGKVGIIFRDITKRKKAEEELRESRTKYQSLTETTSDFIWEIDSTGKYTYCSPQIETIFGLKAAEMIGKTPFDMIPDKEKEEGAKILSEIVAYAKPFFGLQTTACHVNGKLIFVETNGIPFFDGNGKLSGFRGISRDITERKKMEKLMKDNERMAIIGQTAGWVGHDIRNPLQAMVNELYFLKRDLMLRPEGTTRQYILNSLNVLQEQVDYITKIVADLQGYAANTEPKLARVDIERVVRNAFLGFTIPQCVETKFCIQPNLELISDADYLRRIISNLSLNAIQAMSNGGKLTIDVKKNADSVEITVEDTGVGIPEDIKGELFKPLFTTKAKGQGFGLPVVKKYVDQLGGTITFESRVGKGTKFIITLPSF